MKTLSVTRLICPFFLFFPEARARIVGPRERYIKLGSTLKLVCNFEDITRPPSIVFWWAKFLCFAAWPWKKRQNFRWMISRTILLREGKRKTVFQISYGKNIYYFGETKKPKRKRVTIQNVCMCVCCRFLAMWWHVFKKIWTCFFFVFFQLLACFSFL